MEIKTIWYNQHDFTIWSNPIWWWWLIQYSLTLCLGQKKLLQSQAPTERDKQILDFHVLKRFQVSLLSAAVTGELPFGIFGMGRKVKQRPAWPLLCRAGGCWPFVYSRTPHFGFKLYNSHPAFSLKVPRCSNFPQCSNFPHITSPLLILLLDMVFIVMLDSTGKMYQSA